jgi:hypothetical protein
MNSFNDLMFEALDDTLKLMLGKNLYKLVHALKKRRRTLQLDASNEIDSTISYLEKLLGKEGAQIIRTASIKRLCHKLKQEYEEVEAHFLLLDQLYEMKFKLAASTTSKTPEACN